MARWQHTISIISMMALGVACATTNDRNQSFDSSTFKEFKARLISQSPDVEMFLRTGPYEIDRLEDFTIRVERDEVINTDVYLPKGLKDAPLVVFQHGNLASKAEHRYQAQRVASWGMNAMVVEQPNENRWVKNGKVLQKLVNLLHMWPTLLNNSFDKSNIILVGHSFGGSAIAIAAAGNDAVKGLVFLDPAMVNNKVKKSLSDLEVPAVILGADMHVFESRRRRLFYSLKEDNVVELSVKNATHNDAQYPDSFSIGKLFGANWTSGERQERFAAAITASAFSIAATGGTDYVWNAVQPELKRGTFIKAKRK